MLLEFTIALLLGILIGTFTGLTPGIHINLVAVILLGFSGLLFNITTPLIITVFIVSLAITHTFIDYIPSIFLGAPDEDSFLSILPGHRFLLEGKGYNAIILTLYGGILALIVIILYIPFFIYILPKIYVYFSRIMWIILILVSVFLIFQERENKIWATIIFLLAGFLGIASLNLNLKEPLLPLLTGLFGASSLIISIQQKTEIKSQKIEKLKNILLKKRSVIRVFIASVLASPFTSFLPGLGASEAALIGKQILGNEEKESNDEEFLFLLGAINTIVMGLSFITLYSLHRTRTGAAVAVEKLLPSLNSTDLFYIILTIILSGIISFFLAINISKIAAKNIHKIKYDKLSFIILIFLTIIVFFFSDFFNLIGGLVGLLVFITSTFLGIFTITKGLKRMYLMGCLLVPTILFYLI
mgnify:CR=1 FL=1